MYDVAQKFYRGNTTAASDKLLGDFRRGFLGYCSLEAPGMAEKIIADKKEERKKLNAIKSNLKQIQQQEPLRSDYVTKYDIGDKVYKDESGDVIVRKNKKPISLDLFHGNYEGW